MLYERMTGDHRFHEAMLLHRDWLLGRNPWGTSMFSGIPEGGEFPSDIHLPTVQILKRQVKGGLVDGPVYTTLFKALAGLRLNEPDEFSVFQTEKAVYHDDVGDYSTNEPTMDGTADAILSMAFFNLVQTRAGNSKELTLDQGAVVRARTDSRKLALVFTGDEFGEGADEIADTLARKRVKASFFLTGRFYRNPQFADAIRRLKHDGHYLGPHSDGHLLYADWNDRNKMLVTRGEFEEDLKRNYSEMARFGLSKHTSPYFLPPYEWYNQTISEWTADGGLALVNFSPGTGSNADYTTPDMKNYADSEAIMNRIKAFESKDPSGLNGFILLMHIGAGPGRTDKLYSRLPELIDWLGSKGYKPVRVDELLRN
jgi:peptidoglycan/xylan/chitin deacetylase (PgdA/CDA1 family)